MKTVVIAQHRLLHYRVELFQIMKDILHRQDITLELVHGGASVSESKRKDEGSLAWAKKVKNSFFSVKGVDLIWQSAPPVAAQCDLLILIQENRILSNYPNILIRKLLGRKVAYWGHGKNLQSNKPSGFRERWKEKWLGWADWWFAYTPSTVKYLTDKSFPEKQITCLNNAIDTNKFKEYLAMVSDADLAAIAVKLSLPDDAIIGVYCGSLYKEKRLELMVDAADKIRSKVNNFCLVIIGDGPHRQVLEKAADSRSWLSLVGVKTGLEKAVYYRLSHLVLNPGLVGLHVLDSFCAGIPMITTRDALHSPEYDYLEHGVNGLVLDGSSEAYANGIVELLADEQLYQRMKEQCLLDSNKYTVEAMAENFCNGIVNALDHGC